MKKKNTIIIGGGVIGASVAASLAKRGQPVTLIEKDKIGMGCSYGNAGWMTPCFAMPLPMPGMLLKSTKWLLNPEGPLYIKPSLSVDLTYWLTKFLMSMNEKQAMRAIEVLVELSKVSLSAYAELSKDHPEINFEQKGLLMISQTNDGLKATHQELDFVSRFDIPGRKLNSDEVKDFEPALKGDIKGGVYFEKEAHGEPLKIVQALIAEAKAHGAEIIENCEVAHINIENKKVKSITTTNGEIYETEQLVLATGSWSKDIAQQLGLRVPILGGKGYAIITDKMSPNPKHPIMCIDKKIAITPRHDSLRIAGTLELVDQDFSITERRVSAIKKGAKEFLNLPSEIKVHELWRGLRPCTPDGVPLIGYSKKVSNLMLACGHQMLGLQAGLGTGILVADLMQNKKVNYNLDVLNPDRF